MVAQLLTGQAETRALLELLQPERFADGTEPEERLIICGVSWKRYLALDQALGDDRPSPRFYYLDGDLEIITTSREHERIKKWIADFLADYFMLTGSDIIPHGQATMRHAMQQAGAEPDESWCIGEEKEFPDLVLEIALTSGGISKLRLYERFRIPEVWIWHDNRLQLHVLNASGHYETSSTSRLFPDLDMALLERCVAVRSWCQARQTFRAGLSPSARDSEVGN